jgi:drug/metabolite transporter (DMT)-like permease
MPFDLILPLAAAIVYVAAALFLKRATESGAGVWRLTRTCNFVAAIFFAPLWVLGGSLPSGLWWQPAVAAPLFMSGQIFTMVALRVGDVSITTPVLGVKVVLVALLTSVLLREPLTGGVWTAAFLSSVGIGLLHFSRPRAGSRVGTTILIAGLAATSYGLFDVLVQKWSTAWGAGRFLPVMMGFVALYSLPFRPPRGDAVAPASERAAVWTIAGAVCLAVQAILFVSSIAIYRQAAVANVLYSSRGLWSVLAVWAVGHWVGNYEARIGRGHLAWRIAGATTLIIAILCAVRGSSLLVLLH